MTDINNNTSTNLVGEDVIVLTEDNDEREGVIVGIGIAGFPFMIAFKDNGGMKAYSDWSRIYIKEFYKPKDENGTL